MKKESFNIMYEITGKEDGRWTIQAFDRKRKPLGAKITVSSVEEAWRNWLMLNGYSDLEPTQILEQMNKAG
jgi:hypothetical protein